MRRDLSALLLAFGLTGMCGGASAQSQAANESNLKAPILVELFTSEGCSSCPPADELLRRMVGKTTPSGRPVVTLSEHVTYWNRTGWEDPFSTDEATERQQSYVDRMHVDGGVYTPEMVIGGAVQVVGSNAAAVVDAMRRVDQSATGVALRIDSAAVDKEAMEVHFAITGETGKARRIRVVAFVTDDEDQVHVHGGENADRTLTHVSVARATGHIDLRKAESSGVIRVRVPSKPPMGAGMGRHLIVVAQEEGPGAVLAVATRPM